MEMVWDGFIKKEELEVSPGVIDEDRVRALTLNTYMVHIREMILDGSNKYVFAVSEHMEDVMADIYIDSTHTFEDRSPEPKEISAYLKLPENVEARKQLTSLCVNADSDNWPETEKQLREAFFMKDLEAINWNSEERKQNAEKWRKRFERDGFVEL